MAELSAKARKKLPRGEFAGPGRSYPIPDKAHAANAKARATQQVEAGHLSGPEAAKIRAKANKVLGERPKGGTKTSRAAHWGIGGKGRKG